MSSEKNLTSGQLADLVSLLNQRYVRVVRDGYPEENFIMDFHVQESNSKIVTVNAFSKTLCVEMNVETNHMSIKNSVFSDTTINHRMNCGFDMFLYFAHMMIMLSSEQENNPMLMLTILPTVFTVIMVIFTEINSEDNQTTVDVELVQSLLEHTRDIVFDENTSIQSRKK